MISRMQYKDYVWPHNPETLSMERSKNIAEQKIPFDKSLLQDLGYAGRIVTGSGRFTGNGCSEEFGRLASVFSSEGCGLLRLPGMEPFSALFTALTLKGESGPGCVRYEFRFVEGGDAGEEESLVESGQVFVCTGAETLWDIAARFGSDVDALMAKNPQIEWPDDIPAGMKVVLP